MTLSEIPTNPNLENYEFSIAIGGVVYFFKIVYNTRISRYVMTISDSEKNALVGGIPILTNAPLTSPFKYLDIPKGDFLPFGADDENAELKDLGDKVRLYYND